jgi:hypothetical protein
MNSRCSKLYRRIRKYYGWIKYIWQIFRI